MERAKIFVDEDVYDELARALRDKRIDALNAREVNRKGKSDIEQLQFAISHNRALLSFNMADYEALAVECFQKGTKHYGIIISPQRRFRDTLSRVLKLLDRFSAKEMEDQLFYL